MCLGSALRSVQLPLRPGPAPTPAHRTLSLQCTWQSTSTLTFKTVIELQMRTTQQKRFHMDRHGQDKVNHRQHGRSWSRRSLRGLHAHPPPQHPPPTGHAVSSHFPAVHSSEARQTQRGRLFHHPFLSSQLQLDQHPAQRQRSVVCWAYWRLAATAQRPPEPGLPPPLHMSNAHISRLQRQCRSTCHSCDSQHAESCGVPET